MCTRNSGLTNWSFAPGVPAPLPSFTRTRRGDDRKGTARTISRSMPSSQLICVERKKELFLFYVIFVTNSVPQKKLSPSTTTESPKQGSRENVGRKQTPSTSGDRKWFPQKGPAHGKEQEAKTAVSLLCDLEQVTHSLWLHFFPHLSNGDHKGCSEVRMR